MPNDIYSFKIIVVMRMVGSTFKHSIYIHLMKKYPRKLIFELKIWGFSTSHPQTNEFLICYMFKKFASTSIFYPHLWIFNLNQLRTQKTLFLRWIEHVRFGPVLCLLPSADATWVTFFGMNSKLRTHIVINCVNFLVLFWCFLF